MTPSWFVAVMATITMGTVARAAALPSKQMESSLTPRNSFTINEVELQGEPDYTKAQVTVNGTSKVLDLTTPDVRIEDGIIIKPLGPGAFVNASNTPLHLFPEEEIHARARLESRDPDYHCSMWFYCYNSYINIPRGYGLWSWYTIRQNQGESNDGWSGLMVTSPGSTYNAYGPEGQGFSFVDVAYGCRMNVYSYYCTFDIYGKLGSYNHFYP
ncbi:hypothetical protein B0H63DRAFT_529360 [Podospora didyma]|uniref:Glycoside Hydrolase Family 16 n=1 Tax=Podospora didyma TaxID=330526 RepID=A0AAE0K1H0_9PEZI|nr:hypothetical protein B0H63DRAFT_529360 [Podospora didyma]